MSMSPRVVLIASLSLVPFGAWAGAQVFQTTPVFPPKVFAGDDIGFQVTGYDRSVPIGRLVVKIDGKWVEVRESGGASKLSLR